MLMVPRVLAVALIMQGTVRSEMKPKIEERLLALSDRPDTPQAYRELVYKTLPGMISRLQSFVDAV